MTHYTPMKFFEDTRNLSYGAINERDKQRFWKKILIIDDEPDITVTFKLGIESSNNSHNNDSKKIKVYPYNDPLVALSEFKPDFYDLLLVDIDLPHLNGLNYVKRF
jgi:DNA-binding response OmpR family regulator